MYPGIQPDFFEKWLPRRATLRVVIGIWAAGFAVAGATAWRMDRQIAGTDERNVTVPEAPSATTEPVSDIAGSERAISMPLDLVVGHRTPRIGAAPSQKR